MLPTKKPWVRVRGVGGAEFVRQNVCIICTRKTHHTHAKTVFGV